jgi:hypothetical protein
MQKTHRLRRSAWRAAARVQRGLAPGWVADVTVCGIDASGATRYGVRVRRESLFVRGAG